jgi:hypothetical protein
MFPSVVLVTLTVAGVPVLVVGGCEDALDLLDVPPLLPQAASTSPASATIAPPARKVRADLKDIIIRSFGGGIVERTFRSAQAWLPLLTICPIAAVAHP